MGEATFYLRARFPSAEAAADIGLQLGKALARLYALNERWQIIRGDRARSCADRRRELANEFHDLEGMVPWGEIDDACALHDSDAGMNCMAGPLPDISDVPYLERSDVELLLSDTVWHFTDWAGIEHWLKLHGALSTGHLSDECVSPWDSITLS